MNKDKILELFFEILNRWEDAEETVIDNNGESGDYISLAKEKEEYINKINQLCDNLEVE